MQLFVGYYLKVKRRNSLGKLYYKRILVWNNDFKRKIQELKGSDKE